MRSAKDKPENYFEGTLQLRDCSKEVYRFVLEESEKDIDGAIAKSTKVRNGIDCLMQSNKFLTKLGKKLQAKFPGDLKSSVKLFTRDKQTSKEVYRLTVMFRQAEFSKGDRLIFNGEKYTLMTIGKKAILKEESTGKKKQYSFDDLRKLKARKI